MPLNLVKTCLLICFSAVAILQAGAQSATDKLSFASSKGEKITVQSGVISVNGKKLYKLSEDAIIYDSKRNKIIENGGAVFLFLEINGSPNEDRLYAFKVTLSKVDSVADAISSDIKDRDHDGFLEFGGRDLTEVHPSKDSMYYIPFHYYEIRDGKILYDSDYTRKIEREINGVYLPYPLDSHGYCCKVIAKPGKMNGARIDGPANIRDTINGKLLFVLNDNVPVSAPADMAQWYKISLLIDLDSAQFHSLFIRKGETLYVNGLAVGEAKEDIRLKNVKTVNKHLKGTLSGFTAVTNIKSQMRDDE